MILLSSVEIEVKIWIHIYEILPIDFLVKRYKIVLDSHKSPFKVTAMGKIIIF